MTEPHHRAGWYPDPTGRFELRWFDGRWTDQVSAGGHSGVDPLPPAGTGPAAATPTAGAPRPRRRGLMAAAGVLVAVVAAVIVAVLVSGSDGENTTASGDTAMSGDFCSDAQSDWVRVSRAWRTADTIVETGRPYADWGTDQDLLSTTAAMTRQLADEAADRSYVSVNFKTTYTQLSTYLTAAATLAAQQGGTDTDRRRVGQQAPDTALAAVDTVLTVTTGLPGSAC